MRFLSGFWLIWFGWSSVLLAADKPVSLDRAAEVMKAPEGFRVQLAAGEPTVVQPIAFTFDDRGRLWVVECLSYPKWSRDGKGNDRVVILEDPDAQGTYRKRTVVIDNGVNLSGLELGFGGLYLCSTPNLIYIPLKDDKPAGEPQVLLDGWNLNDAKHNVFNSLMWGPDGWLYGCNGIQTRSWVGKPGTPQGERTFIDCGVWRYHPTRHVFDVVAVGTTNPWGLDWDSHGEMFITNCVIDHLWHVVPGGRYQRMYGQDSNPYSYGFMGPATRHRHWGGGAWTESRADRATGAIKKQHDDAGGGHAHSGAAIYLSDNFPKEYHNSIFMCNIHGNRVNRDRLNSRGKRIGQHEVDFLFANDTWFRGICLKVGPEGALYVSDWSDTGECHNYDVADTSNGRIYRVSFGQPRPFQGDVSRFTNQELLNTFTSGNEWLVRKARRVLQERAVAGKLPESEIIAVRNALHSDKSLSAVARLRQAWLLFAIDRFNLADTEVLLEYPELHPWAIRMAGTLPEAMPLLLDWIPKLAQADSVTRGALASVMMKRTPEEAIALAKVLFQQPTDTSDSDLTQLYWLGIQPAVLKQPAQALAIVNQIQVPRVRCNIVRLVCSLPGSDITGQMEKVLPVLRAAGTERDKGDILAGLLQALEGRRQVKAPKGWDELYPILSASPSEATLEATESLALILGDTRVVEDLKARMLNAERSPMARQRAITRLTQQKLPGLAPTLRTLLKDPAVRGAAIRGLASYADETTPPAILAVYPDLTSDEKADAIQTLASRASFAMNLLTSIEKNQLPKSDLSAFSARQIQSLQDKQVKQKLEQVWGTVRPASATRVAQTKIWKEYLTPETLKQANASAGRKVYQQNCASCHKLFGEGGEVGPELTGSQRVNLDYVLENVLDPSAVVPSEWRMSVFNLIDGRTLTGIIRKETPQAVTVRTLNEEVIVPTADIETRKPTGLSIMPDGLFEKLTREQVRDLVAYLASREQVP